jgi:hypothetical protein
MPPALCVDGVCPPPSTPQPINLNLSAIPWHNGAGAWGPQVRIDFPALPVTTRTVNVSTLDQFNQAAAVAGTLINITASWAGNTTAVIAASNVDVVIRPGISVGAIEVGAYPRTSPVSRVRIRGTTPGMHSGGRMGQYRDFTQASDITIDGIDMNGDSGFPVAETNQAFRASGTRLAVLNTRAIAAGYIWLGSARHVIIANSNLYHGAATEATVGYTGGWGIRNTAGPFTIVDSRIQGTRYNNLRVHSSNGSGELLYVARTTFVNTAEGGRAAWLWDNLNATSSNGQGAIFEDNRVYSYGVAGCPAYTDLRAPDVTYSRVRRTQFFSGGSINWSQAALDSAEKLPGGDHDWSVSNAFSSFSALPPWGGPGDPTQIPIPVAPSLRGQGACISPF